MGVWQTVCRVSVAVGCACGVLFGAAPSHADPAEPGGDTLVGPAATDTFGGYLPEDGTLRAFDVENPIVGRLDPALLTAVQEATRAHPQDPQAKERGLLTYLIERQPDYLVVFPDWYPWLTSRTDLFQPHYFVTLKENVISGGDTMVVYHTVWGEPQEAQP